MAKHYKIQHYNDRYILLKRKSRWNVLGYIALCVATFGILNLADWLSSFDGISGGFMDFEAWTWVFLGCFESSELAVEAKIRDECFSDRESPKEYYL
jgi:hypothetical protein